MSYCRNQQTIQEYQGRLCGRSLASHACAIGREQRDSLTHLNEWTFPINLHFAFYQSRNTGDSFIASKMWKPSLTVQEFDNVKGWREISVLNRVQACFNKLRDRAGSRQPSMRAHAQRAYTKKGDLTGFLRNFCKCAAWGIMLTRSHALIRASQRVVWNHEITTATTDDTCCINLIWLKDRSTISSTISPAF